MIEPNSIPMQVSKVHQHPYEAMHAMCLPVISPKTMIPARMGFVVFEMSVGGDNIQNDI